MHACVEGAVVTSVEHDDLRGTRACDTRVIHEAWRRAQVVIRDALSPHVAEIRSAVRGGWPFNGEPFTAAAARFGAELIATPVRACTVAAVVAVTALITFVAHVSA
jgi:hypothetical protein